jgi:hypothetical protein
MLGSLAVLYSSKDLFRSIERGKCVYCVVLFSFASLPHCLSLPLPYCLTTILPHYYTVLPILSFYLTTILPLYSTANTA